MLISVVTVCLNSISTIGDTLASVAAQRDAEVEHIVIDGGSTDGTLDMLHRHGGRIATLVSEPDQGLFDAMNKGLRRATGDVVGFLNSDDVYADDSVLREVAALFESSDADACCLRHPHQLLPTRRRPGAGRARRGRPRRAAPAQWRQ